MRDSGIEIGLRLVLLLDGADKPVQALKSAKFVSIAESGGIKRRLKN